MRYTDQIRVLCDLIDGGVTVPPIVVPPVITPPVVTPPTGTPSSIPPFTHVINREWVYGTPFPKLDTYNAPDGPLTPHGLVVVAFTPQADPLGHGVSVTAYPGTMIGCDSACSISTVPGDFGQPFPWTRYGWDTGIQFFVSPVAQRGAPSLIPGVRYYINIANINAAGQCTAVDAGDIRVEMS